MRTSTSTRGSVRQAALSWCRASVFQISCLYSQPIARARQISRRQSNHHFAQWAVREVLVLVISNADISGPIHSTVLKFGEHARVIILFVPTKFHAAQITRSRSSKGVVSPRLCVFSLQCSTTSTLDISASLGPIWLRFGGDVPVSVLQTSSKAQVSRPLHSWIIHRGFARSQEKQGYRHLPII